jgi:U-box domain
MSLLDEDYSSFSRSTPKNRPPSTSQDVDDNSAFALRQDGVRVPERHAILQWIERGNLSCPLTKQRLSYSDIVPHHGLRSQIECWRVVNHIPATKGGGNVFHERKYGVDQDDDEEPLVAVLSVSPVQLNKLAAWKKRRGSSGLTVF